MRISDWGSDVCSSDLGPTSSIGWKPIWTRRKGRTMEKLFETWSLEREIVLVKVLKHPRHKVFAAWMDPDALAQWYGPTGLAIENHEADIREGGVGRDRKRTRLNYSH